MVNFIIINSLIKNSPYASLKILAALFIYYKEVKTNFSKKAAGTVHVAHPETILITEEEMTLQIIFLVSDLTKFTCIVNP